jgi:hypothetical protein
MNGQQFLQKLSGFPFDSFEYYFSQIADSLCLGEAMGAGDLRRLSEAALLARLCNIAFNGSGDSYEDIKPEREFNRIRLEQKFMVSMARLRDCAGWNSLSRFQRETAARFFLEVSVAEDHLAPES